MAVLYIYLLLLGRVSIQETLLHVHSAAGLPNNHEDEPIEKAKCLEIEFSLSWLQL